jgi:P-type Cu2+ transporter
MNHEHHQQHKVPQAHSHGKNVKSESHHKDPGSKIVEGHKRDGMDHSQHDKHAGHHTEDFLKRFWICLALTVPVLMLSEMIQHWFGFHVSFPQDKYVLLTIGSIIYFYGGAPFLKGMVTAMGAVLMSLSTIIVAINAQFLRRKLNKS